MFNIQLLVENFAMAITRPLFSKRQLFHIELWKKRVKTGYFPIKYRIGLFILMVFFLRKFQQNIEMLHAGTHFNDQFIHECHSKNEIFFLLFFYFKILSLDWISDLNSGVSYFFFQIYTKYSEERLNFK